VKRYRSSSGLPGQSAEEKFDFKKVPGVFASFPRVLRLVWSASRGLTVALAILNLLQGVLPAFTVSITALLIDSVVQAIQSRSAAPLWWPIGLQLGSTVLASLLSTFSTTIQQLLQEQVSNRVQLDILKKASTLDLAFFEDPASYDTMRRATNQSTYQPTTMVAQTFSLGQALVTLASLLFLLFHLAWWLAVIALLLPLPAFFFNAGYGWRGYQLRYHQSSERRLMNYFAMLLTTDIYHKEIKLFDLSDFFLARFWQLAQKLYQQDKKLLLRRSLTGSGWSNLMTIANSGIYLYVALQAIAGRITLGGLTLYTQTATQVGQNVQSVLQILASTYENTLYVNLLFEFLAYQPRICSPIHPQPLVCPAQTPGLTIEFRNVSFTYPGKSQPALEQVSFTMRAGEAVALVGHNGAGKTTLIKLLTRLYEPDEGEILIGGRNIQAYDLRELHQQIGVIFQDFVNYYLTARENIGVGRIEEIENRELVRKAAGKSGVHAFIERLPQGYETTLGLWFGDTRESVQLSGGEWQKIALARAFMRDARILILDEPTSSLDAQAEYDVFTHVRSLMARKTTLFVSHRFSTVRLADRILVLEQGKIVESGTHEELLALGKRYAELFHLQAEAYR
jgi:ATP-binding cassette subfamily B protein